MRYDSHLSDELILQAIDGELSQPKSAEIQAHLAQCWKCRTRRTDLEKAIGDFVHLQQTAYDSKIPNADGPTAQLRARMAVLSTQPQSWGRRLRPLAVAAVCAILAIGLVAIWNTRQVPSGSRPDSRLTPGATRSISVEQVCAAPDDDDSPAVSVQLASQVFEEYGIRQPRPKAYELDYLITPRLGGASDVRNLWPQPYTNGVWTAHIKDALEDYLRAQVCSGKIDLATAQHEIASDWISAYRKYFHTNRPLPAHALFLKDRPWE